MSKISIQDVQAIIRQFDASGWRELRLRMEGLELTLDKDASGALHKSLSFPAAIPVELQTAAPVEVASLAANPEPTHEKAIPVGWSVVRAPSLGTFYRAPKPGTAALTEVGARVTPDSEVCLIEVMKLFTTVRAGLSGTVREVYVNDSELVEFSQPLFLIEPDG